MLDCLTEANRYNKNSLIVTCIAYFGFGLTTPNLERVVIECPISLDTLAGKDCELTNTCSFDCSVGPKGWLDVKGTVDGHVISGEVRVGTKAVVDAVVISGEVWVGTKGVVDDVVISGDGEICGVMVVSG